MTSKLCKNCGHGKEYHAVKHRGRSEKCRFMYVSTGECKCKKFEVEDETVMSLAQGEYRKRPWFKPDKQQKGCGKPCVENDKMSVSCGLRSINHGILYLCPLCSKSSGNDLQEFLSYSPNGDNQSPGGEPAEALGVMAKSSEDNSTSKKVEPSGIQSPTSKGSQPVKGVSPPKEDTQTLSDKIWGAKAWEKIVEVVDVKDVKNSIIRLKEELCTCFIENIDRTIATLCRTCREIDKIFGSKLVKGGEEDENN